MPPSPDPAGGWFGSWALDEAGDPCFDLSVMPRPELVLPEGGVEALWHQLGNARITATTHAGGSTSIYSTSRGMARLTGAGSTWGIVGCSTSIDAVRWGMGYTRWTARSGDVQVVRRISVEPGDAPVLRIDVELGPVSGRSVAYQERWPAEPWPLFLGGLMSPRIPAPPGYSLGQRLSWWALYSLSGLSRRVTDLARATCSHRMVRRPRFDPALRAMVLAPRVERDWPSRGMSPAWFDRSLPYLFVASVGHQPVSVGDDALRVTVGGDCQGVESPMPEARLSFVVGLADRARDIDTLITSIEPHTRPIPIRPVDEEISGPCSPRLRVDLEPVPDSMLPIETIAREATWHAEHLLEARQHDAYFGRAYVAQGSAYSFVHGLQGAPRDYALFSVPLAFIDPASARALLEVALMMTRPSGAVHYAHTGRGRCTAGGLHASPTDLPIFLLWAVTEYVWATGDRSFLDDPVPFYPSAAGRAASPRERIGIAFGYLRDRVGLGAHGMLRVGSGDWADPISAMVGDRRALHRDGESGFNTAFGAYVLPRAAALLADDDPDLGAEMIAFAEGLREAMVDAWTGEWFLRGWDGRGAPIGAEHLFLDAQVWALIGEVGSAADRSRLVAEIGARSDDPSPIGATILDRPHHVRAGMLAPGWDCNGGVWAAINGLLAWGYAVHDPARAWLSLAGQSFAAHARAYPHIWHGIWSGPDAFNAHFGSRPGETFVQPATPMTEFPTMNANAHAGPLLGLMRTLGIETEPGGIVVRDRGRLVPRWRWSSPLATLSGGGPTA